MRAMPPLQNTGTLHYQSLGCCTSDADILSKCDTYRPCSLCRRANVECVTDGCLPGQADLRVAPELSLSDNDGRATPLHKRRRRETQTSQGSVAAASAYTRSHSQLSHSLSPRSPADPAHDHDGESAITIARKVRYSMTQYSFAHYD